MSRCMVYRRRAIAVNPDSARTAATQFRSTHSIRPLYVLQSEFTTLLSEVETHLALLEGCKHALEIAIPAAEVETETSRVVSDVQKRAKLPGYPIRTVARVAMPSMAKMLEALQGMMGADAQGATEGGVLMSSTTELVSVRTDPIAADRFAVPAGFTKNPSKLAKKKTR